MVFEIVTIVTLYWKKLDQELTIVVLYSASAGRTLCLFEQESKQLAQGLVIRLASYTIPN